MFVRVEVLRQVTGGIAFLMFGYSSWDLQDLWSCSLVMECDGYLPTRKNVRPVAGCSAQKNLPYTSAINSRNRHQHAPGLTHLMGLIVVWRAADPLEWIRLNILGTVGRGWAVSS
jgi:hypothetical protein